MAPGLSGRIPRLAVAAALVAAAAAGSLPTAASAGPMSTVRLSKPCLGPSRPCRRAIALETTQVGVRLAHPT